MHDNQITRAGGMPPLVMVFEGAQADFTGNQFVGSGVAAIRSQGRIFVSDNQFDCPAPRKGGGPPQQAVWALEGSMVSMTDDNVIDGCRLESWGASGSGIDMVGCHDGVIYGSKFTHSEDVANANGVQAKGGSSKIAIRRCRFERNLVVFRSDELRTAVNIGANTEPKSFRLLGNERLCLDGKSASDVLLPFPVPQSGGYFHVQKPRADLSEAELKKWYVTSVGVRWLSGPK